MGVFGTKRFLKVGQDSKVLKLRSLRALLKSQTLREVAHENSDVRVFRTERLLLLCVVKTPSGSKFNQLSGGTGTDSLL